MTFELIGKKKATLTDVDPQSVKMGQTDTKPAVAITLKNILPNSYLDLLDKTLLPFMYCKGNPAAQAPVEGVDPIALLTQLTPAAMNMGQVQWAAEQTGCQLSIYHGISDIPPIVLKDVTVRKIKVDCLEGGTTEWAWVAYTMKDIDADVMGQLGVLKSHDLDIELTAPEQLSQKKGDLLDTSDEQLGSPSDTVLGAMVKAGPSGIQKAIARNERKH